MTRLTAAVLIAVALASSGCAALVGGAAGGTVGYVAGASEDDSD